MNEVRGRLEELLPAEIAVRVCAADVAAPVGFPEEEQTISRAAERRVREFRLGRALARECLAALGEPPAAIPIGENRAPRFPEGYVGSVSHCADAVCAVAARTRSIRSVGIDIERFARLGERLEERILTPGEAQELRAVAPEERAVRAGLAFSAKEVIHKNVSPLFGRNLRFLDVSIAFEFDAGRWSVSSASDRSRDLPWSDFRGVHSRSGDLVVTAGYFPA